MDTRPILLVMCNGGDVGHTLRALAKSDIQNEVVVAKDGVEALEYIFGKGKYDHRDPDELPSLVLLDLELPGIDGLGVLRQMRTSELTKLVPVVVLTSSEGNLEQLRSYRLGANSCIRKPSDPCKFDPTIQLITRYWLSLNEPA
jgi:two-component system response regulator